MCHVSAVSRGRSPCNCFAPSCRRSTAGLCENTARSSQFNRDTFKRPSTPSRWITASTCLYEKEPAAAVSASSFYFICISCPSYPPPPCPSCFFELFSPTHTRTQRTEGRVRCGALSLLQKPLHYMEVQQNSCPGLNGKFIDLRIACAVRRVLPLPGFEVSSAYSLNS